MKQLTLLLWLLSLTSFVSVASVADLAEAPTARCPAPDRPYCIADIPYTTDEILARLGTNQQALWVDEEEQELTFVYRGYADWVALSHSLGETMERLNDGNLWVLTVRIENLSQAVISYVFLINGRRAIEGGLYRGVDSPRSPERIPTLRGEILQTSLEMPHDTSIRDLTIYLPPNHNPEQTYPVVYSADGSAVAELAHYIEPLIHDDEIEAIILVGVHSSEYRREEYIPAIDWERFYAHEVFLTKVVREWAEETLGASPERDDRGVFGVSNGGVFAMTMALRHPDLYGHSFPFSAGVNPLRQVPTLQVDNTVQYYFVAGYLEEGFYRTTNWLYEHVSDSGAEATFRPWVSGHDWVIWAESFPDAVRSAFGTS
ncbi:MAG: alpha/beta hydrolase-fold protein [Chloroflexota bacterium]